jgi:hypothetical protein
MASQVARTRIVPTAGDLSDHLARFPRNLRAENRSANTTVAMSVPLTPACRVA